MACFSGPEIVNDGLVEVIDPYFFAGGSAETLTNKQSSSTILVNNFTQGTSTNYNTFQSNVIADGSGTSYITLSRNTALETGSITYSVWFNLEGLPISVGANNNWRGFLCTADSGTAGSPFTMVLEQSNAINFSTTTAGTYRRNLNSAFNPYTVTTNGWQNLVYTYNSITGNAACYKDGVLVLSGPMTADSSGTNPTAPGDGLTYTNYQASGFRIYGGTSTGANPNGNGMCPGELGCVHIYNKALTATEVRQNFEALRGRFGI